MPKRCFYLTFIFLFCKIDIQAVNFNNMNYIATTTCETESSSSICITTYPDFTYGDIMIIFFLFLIFSYMFFNGIINITKK